VVGERHRGRFLGGRGYPSEEEPSTRNFRPRPELSPKRDGGKKLPKKKSTERPDRRINRGKPTKKQRGGYKNRYRERPVMEGGGEGKVLLKKKQKETTPQYKNHPPAIPPNVPHTPPTLLQKFPQPTPQNTMTNPLEVVQAFPFSCLVLLPLAFAKKFRGPEESREEKKAPGEIPKKKGEKRLPLQLHPNDTMPSLVKRGKGHKREATSLKEKEKRNLWGENRSKEEVCSIAEKKNGQAPQ